MKKNKGFTLVELLAVIVVLAIILAIAIPTVLNVISNTRYNSFKSNEELFVKTTKTYLASNNNLLPQTLNETSKVFLNDLINNSYMEDIKDPLSNVSCNSIASYVLITNTGVNKYSYKPALVCDNYISVNNFNLATNGEFNDGTTNWLSVSLLPLSVVNGRLRVAANTSSGQHFVQQRVYDILPNSIIVGHTYYGKVDLNIINGKSSFFLYNRLNDGYDNYESANSPIVSTSGTQSLILEVTSMHAEPVFLFRVMNYNMANNNMFVGSNEEVHIDNAVLIDLTATYGAGNEPAKDVMDRIISNMQK